MTIKTLTFIHNLLLEEVEKTKGANDYIRNVAYKAKCAEAPNANFLTEQANKAWNKYQEANNALIDFEQKEW